MEETEKLGRLIEHWIEHNEGHLDAYLDWAGKARAMGREDVASLLEQVAAHTKEIEGLFRQARKALS
jgi:hypothetical protein